MTFAALPTLQKNSLSTTTTSNMTTSSTEVEVTEQAVFYRDGVLLTNGWELGPDNAVEFRTEEVTVTSTDATSGAGTVFISTRAVKADGTNGPAYAWPSGTRIRNTFSTSVYDQVKDNFAKIQTTAAQSIYVDKAATGTGDGTSWTNAFATIQAAINSLPTVLEHAVTIYIRKGSTAYSETPTIRQITGKGSLTIRGEYYWNGQCAAAGTAAANKFRLTATDGANIANGDHVLITSGYGGAGTYNYYVFTTVSSVSSIGSNVYEVTLTDSLDSGNIGTTEYYTVVKTDITGGITVTGSSGINLYGLYISGPIVFTDHTNISSMAYVFVSAASGTIAITAYNGSNVSGTRNCYFSGLVGIFSSVSSSFTANTSTAGANVAVSLGASGAIYSSTNSYIIFRYGILKGGASSYGCYIFVNAIIDIYYVTVVSGTSVGIFCSQNSFCRVTTVYNNATTPKNPASSTDASYIT
jgi:Tfp pilus assembly protein PilX